MKSISNFYTSLLLLVLFSLSIHAQRIENYHVTFDKRGEDRFALFVKVNFTLDFEQADSVAMNFGAREKEIIDSLTIDSHAMYRLSPYKITFYKGNRSLCPVSMSYLYMDISSFIMYTDRKEKKAGDAEIWECGSREHYYPYISHQYMDVHADFLLPDSLRLIAAYPTQEIAPHHYAMETHHMEPHSLSFAFYKDSAYTERIAAIPDTIRVLQIKGKYLLNDKRFNKLIMLTKSSIKYFGRIYGEPYLSKELSITHYPTFLFYSGKTRAARNDIGFILGPQYKASTYPDLYPLVHEIGHRWMGEWTMFIDDGQPAAYFIQETLNEFMTRMYLRDCLGKKVYQQELDIDKEEYGKIENTSKDRSLYSMKYNNYFIVVYSKGPIILDKIAQKIGYHQLRSVIAQFYREYRGKTNVRYEDFIAVLAKKYPKASRDLDRMVKNKGF